MKKDDAVGIQFPASPQERDVRLGNSGRIGIIVFLYLTGLFLNSQMYSDIGNLD